MEQLFGPVGIIVILVVVILIFGPKQLPKLGKMFGQTMKSVRQGVDEMNTEMKGEDAKSTPSEIVVPEAKASTDAPALVCAKCGASAPSGTKFCPECGTPLVAPSPTVMTCTKCGTESPAGTKFCPECGAAL